MAESKDNVVIHGLSGKFAGVIVFRQRAGKTIAAKAPVARGSQGTPGQQAINKKFQQAVLYGKAVNADPPTKETYQSAAPRGQSAYNVAIADFLRAPDIHEIDISGYAGNAGDKIRVKVTDDFRVATVRLSIHNADGSLQEEGDAVLDTDGGDWVYTATPSNATLSGDKITVTAADIPDNLSTEEKIMH